MKHSFGLCADRDWLDWCLTLNVQKGLNGEIPDPAPVIQCQLCPGADWPGPHSAHRMAEYCARLQSFCGNQTSSHQSGKSINFSQPNLSTRLRPTGKV